MFVLYCNYLTVCEGRREQIQWILFLVTLFLQVVSLHGNMHHNVSKRALVLQHILKGELFTRTKLFLTTRETVSITGTSHLYPLTSNKDLALSTFHPDQKTIFIIPGWQSFPNMDWMQLMTKKLLVRQSCNVIQVSWAESASNLYYPKAASDTALVGKVLHKFILLLQSVYKYPLSKIHLIGFSMGAHIAGFTGARFKGKVGRITGLDPAGPLFNDEPPSKRLDPKDAQFVDVIHTSSEGLALGTTINNGHIDFWPNGGVHQPGCDKIGRVRETSKLTVSEGVSHFQELSTNLGCSHFRSAYYFIESINGNCKFIGKQCRNFNHFLKNECPECSVDPGKNCIVMGYNASWGSLPFPARHSFYLLTHSKAPFCRFT